MATEIIITLALIAVGLAIAAGLARAYYLGYIKGVTDKNLDKWRKKN